MTCRVLGLLLALLVSVPVTAQTPWQLPRTADGQPDIQGIWRFVDAPQASLAALVSLEGERGPLWQDVSRWLQVEATISDFKVLAPSFVVDPPDGKIPYQPWTAAKRREFFANSLTPTKLEHIDPNTRGWLTGVPRIQHYPNLCRFCRFLAPWCCSMRTSTPLA